MLGASTRLTVAMGLVAMLGFVVLVRPTDSVLRAAVMGSVSAAPTLCWLRSHHPDRAARARAYSASSK